MLGSLQGVAAASHVHCQMVKSWQKGGVLHFGKWPFGDWAQAKIHALGRMSDFKSTNAECAVDWRSTGLGRDLTSIQIDFVGYRRSHAGVAEICASAELACPGTLKSGGLQLTFCHQTSAMSNREDCHMIQSNCGLSRTLFNPSIPDVAEEETQMETHIASFVGSRD